MKMTISSSRALFAYWLSEHRVQLKRKEKLCIPCTLGHPRHVGFKLWTYAAEPAPRKARDWVCPLGPGQGRLHAWEMVDDSFIVHWDEYDPAQSIPEMLSHCWHESPMARTAIVVGAIFLGVSALSSLEQGRLR